VELEAVLNRARKLKKAKLRTNNAENEETSVEKLAREIATTREANGGDDGEEEKMVGFENATEVLTFNETAEFARSLGEIPGGSAGDDMFGTAAAAGPSSSSRRAPRSPTPDENPFEKFKDADEDMEISEEEGQ
jgi:hypothetical protein